MNAPSDRDLILERLSAVEQHIAESDRRAEERHAELLAALGSLAAGGDGATIDGEAAAELGGYPSVDALRVAAGRDVAIKAARVGRNRWSREKLIAATVNRRRAGGER